jgi:tRNA(Ile)-lysidine synthetase-like protein
MEVNSFFEDWITHSEYWFNTDKIYDTYISEKYVHLLTTAIWDATNDSLKYHLAYIILYDQVPRHAFRNNDAEGNITIYLNKALILHEYITKHFDLSELTALEWSFLNLPVRHSDNTNNIIRVIQDTWKRVKCENDEEEINKYTLFLKASYMRLSKNQFYHIEESVSEKHFNTEYNILHFSQYINILGNYPFINNIPKIPIQERELYTKIEENIIKNKLKHVIISLSGGIDSMVCSYILKELQKVWGFKMVAVHINYNNRDFTEYEFVRDWCIYMKIPLYTRHIIEINRNDSIKYGMRNIYEEYTKNIRFETYKNVWENYICINDYPKVILGHNYDDCFENIITNICNKSKYENLIGMNEYQVVSEILFLRPILSIEKKNIYVFGNTYNIPYLHDSTPEWSERGKIRDIIKPAFNNWNKEAIPAFFELSKKLNEYEDIAQCVINNVLKDVIYEDNTIKFDLVFDNLLLITTIWKKLFEKLNIKISYKSLNYFMQKIENSHFNNKNMPDNTKVYSIMVNKLTTFQYKFITDKMNIEIIKSSN